MVGQRPQMHPKSSWGWATAPWRKCFWGFDSLSHVKTRLLTPLPAKPVLWGHPPFSPLLVLVPRRSWPPRGHSWSPAQRLSAPQDPLQTFPAWEHLSTLPPPVVAATMQVLEVTSCIIAIHGSPFLPNGKLPETKPHVSLIVGLPGAWYRGWVPLGCCNYSLDWIPVGEQLGNLQATWEQKPASRGSTTPVLTAVRAGFRG